MTDCQLENSYMASNKQQGERKKKKACEQKPALKHLGFVRAIAINILFWLSDLYQHYTKQQHHKYSGALVYVETTIAPVVTPLYSQFKDVPDALLLFLDTKVDEATLGFDKLAPPLAKQLLRQTKSVVVKLSDAAIQLGKVVKADGPTAALHYAYDSYKDPVLIQLAKLWQEINKISSLNVVAQMLLPTVCLISDKYNEVIADMAGKGYSVFCCLPSVPIDDIARAYKQVEAAACGGKSAASDESRQTKIV
ncbi:putative rubber elongation factor [Heracleum sosnowskyi]|uniref:Rubber elongation factor n=1 Tax=Heracleum sosnowskyi TaxID=360622 RepID=A0AAD8JEN2_9APIA|nr:putative rubber elongation factor [Heracleum sosnowskyi]